MGAYAASVTSVMSKAVKIDAVTGIGIFAGKCDITNYNSTLAEITAITGKLKSLICVVVTGISDNGYHVRWDASGEAFKAYDAVADHTHAIAVTAGTAGDAVTNNSGVLESTGGENLVTEASTAVAADEAATDTDVGVVEFVAYGLV